MKKIIIIIALIAAFFAADLTLTYNNFIKDSDYFTKNDFEITQYKHPEKVWDKVFYGNSCVMSGYIEDLSSSGYVNLGVSYGTAKDLVAMIDKRHVKIGSELVIGLNELFLYDDLHTNPTYMWHKKWYTPYPYFERDRFYPIITDGFDKLLHGEDPMPAKRFSPQEKYTTHGVMSDEEAAEKLEKYEREYFNLPDEAFSDNLAALEKIIRYCEKNDIRVRMVWMPWNPKFTKPDILARVHVLVQNVCDKYGVEQINMEDILPEECFYDMGHMNREVGAPAFTALVDEWL